MKCKIMHESRGRIRVHLCIHRMTLAQADLAEFYLRQVEGVKDVRVYDRACDVVVFYEDLQARSDVIRALSLFSFQKAESMDVVPEHTSRVMNREFEDKIVFTKDVSAFSCAFCHYDLPFFPLYQRRIDGFASRQIRGGGAGCYGSDGIDSSP